MRETLRATASLIIAALASLAATGGIADAGPADVGGFVASASAASVQTIYDDADSPIPVHPSIEGSAPYAEVQHSGGLAARALASLAWPGPTVANGGTASEQFGFPPGVIPNYPVRAEALSPQGPETIRNSPAPGVLMEATAREAGTTAVASNDDAGVAPVALVRSARTLARTKTDDRSVTASASSLLKDLAFLDGLLTIDAVSTRVEVTTDGRRGEGVTRVTGVSLGGAKIYLDNQGLSVGPGQPARPTDAVTDPIDRRLLRQAGFSLALAPQVTERTPTRIGRYSGGLIISWRSADGKRSWMQSLGAARAEIAIGSAAGPFGAEGEAGDPSGPTLIAGRGPADPEPIEAPGSRTAGAMESPAPDARLPLIGFASAGAVGTAIGAGLAGAALLLVLAAARGLVGLWLSATAVASMDCREGDRP